MRRRNTMMRRNISFFGRRLRHWMCRCTSIRAQRRTIVPLPIPATPNFRGSAWGFHVETAEHMLRLMMSGLFEKLPTLCIIIGHLGELLPFWAWRIDHRIKREGWDQWAGEHGRPRKLTVTEY